MTDNLGSLLKRQLELTRFERALEVSESLADHRALLTTTELARLNQILTGDSVHSPWRHEATTITLPSGKLETMALIIDPIQLAREKLHLATEKAENGNILDAAVDIYVDLILNHVFLDANRRSAVLASHYFLKRYGAPVSGIVLHEIGAGDLRQKEQIDALREVFYQIVRFAKKSQEKKNDEI